MNCEADDGSVKGAADYCVIPSNTGSPCVSQAVFNYARQDSCTQLAKVSALVASLRLLQPE